MKKRFLSIIATLGLISVFSLSFVPVTHAAGIDVFAPCKANSDSSICKANTQKNGVFTLLKNVINILLFVAGAISVIVIIVGGIKYVTSAGDSAGVNNAKNTILYAVIGLAIAVMAFAIVNFVIGRL